MENIVMSWGKVTLNSDESVNLIFHHTEQTYSYTHGK